MRSNQGFNNDLHFTNVQLLLVLKYWTFVTTSTGHFHLYNEL